MRHQAAGKSRIEIIDVARGGALVAMAVYHFGWDLEFFGYMDAGTTVTGGWRLFARAIATSFLFLVGVSLFLAHEKRIRWKGFLKPAPAGGDYSIAVKCSGCANTTARQIDDVTFGDVWVSANSFHE